MADGRMAKVGLNSLLMDADEVRRLLVAHPDWIHGTDDNVVSDLLAVTKGWASGIGVLIELTKTQQTTGPFRRSAAREMVFENFSDQIFATFSSEERHQLMLVASCPVLYPQILRDVLGGGICRLLERLCRNGMLVSKEFADSDEAEPRYRLHALLRDFLYREGKRKLRPRELRSVCARLAHKLLTLGEDDAARDLLLEARDWKGLAANLESAAEKLFATGRIRSLTRFVTALPAPIREQSAQLRYWRGLCLLHLDPSEFRRDLTMAYGQFKSLGDQVNAIRAWGALVDTISFEWEDCARLDAYIDDLSHLSPLGETLNSPELTTILTKGAFAAMSIRQPDHPDFQRWERRNLALFQRRLPKSETIRRGLQLMIHYVYGSGERRKAEVVRARLQQIYGRRQSCSRRSLCLLRRQCCLSVLVFSRWQPGSCDGYDGTGCD